MSPIPLFIIFGISLISASLFAFIETAVTGLRQFKVKELENEVKGYQFLFKTWEEKPQRILISALIVSNFFDVLCSVTITEIMQFYFGNLGLAIGVAVATLMILVFGNILPKTFAKTAYVSAIKWLLWFISLVVWFLYWPVSILLRISHLIFGYFGGDEALESSDAVSEEEIKFLIGHGDERGVLDTEKTEMLQNVFGLGQIPVSKVMIPETDMVVLDISASLEKAMETIRHYRYSRIPVYEGKDDNIIGIIYHKDLFDVNPHQNVLLKELVRPVMFVPESKRINQLLNEFLKKRMHMSIVVDEFGGVVGLVTLEDLIEEIVGEISDEHEKIHTGIVPLEQGGWLVNAGIVLDKLEDLLDIDFGPGDSLTLGGFLSEQLQHLPKCGECVNYRGYCFKIQEASEKRVLQVLITVNSKPEA